ncbi:MAG: phage holin family protein [Novosphingobium sp.]
MAELQQLGDEARTYAESEFAFQKARAIALGQTVRKAAVLVAIGFVVLVFALVALVAGLLIGLSSLVGPWWATAIVVGALLLAGLTPVFLVRSLWRRTMRRLFIEGQAK